MEIATLPGNSACVSTSKVDAGSMSQRDTILGSHVTFTVKPLNKGHIGDGLVERLSSSQRFCFKPMEVS